MTPFCGEKRVPPLHCRRSSTPRYFQCDTGARPKCWHHWSDSWPTPLRTKGVVGCVTSRHRSSKQERTRSWRNRTTPVVWVLVPGHTQHQSQHRQIGVRARTAFLETSTAFRYGLAVAATVERTAKRRRQKFFALEDVTNLGNGLSDNRQECW